MHCTISLTGPMYVRLICLSCPTHSTFAFWSKDNVRAYSLILTQGTFSQKTFSLFSKSWHLYILFSILEHIFHFFGLAFLAAIMCAVSLEQETKWLLLSPIQTRPANVLSSYFIHFSKAYVKLLDEKNEPGGTPLEIPIYN